MPRIFISYRRQDAAAHAGRLYDRLAGEFGKDAVFMDVDTVELGVDFVERIESAVGSSDVLLAVIGRDWLSSTDAGGNRRLDNSDDFVRIEISAALQRGIRVVPVLVEGAKMPAADELPDALVGIARRQALEVYDSQWNAGVERLTSTLKRVPKTRTPGSTPARLRGLKLRPPPTRRTIAIVVTVAVIALAGSIVAISMMATTGGAKLVMPNVVGLNRGQAARAIEHAGLRLGSVTPASGSKTDRVTDQSPAAGTSVTRRSSISIVLLSTRIDWRIVKHAFITSLEQGPPEPHILGKRLELWAYFTLGSVPPPTAKIVVRWYLPNGKVVGQATKKSSTTLISNVRSNAFLPTGVWRAVLDIDGKDIAEATATLD
jgi:hypothetical protein